MTLEQFLLWFIDNPKCTDVELEVTAMCLNPQDAIKLKELMS